MQEQEIKNLMAELNNVKEQLSQEIMKNVELEKEKADLIIAATSACDKYDKLNKELSKKNQYLNNSEQYQKQIQEYQAKVKILEEEIDCKGKELNICNYFDNNGTPCHKHIDLIREELKQKNEELKDIVIRLETENGKFIKGLIKETIEENQALRKWLWLKHGCSELYGDDEEMQCNKGLVDFKRGSIESINKHLNET